MLAGAGVGAAVADGCALGGVVGAGAATADALGGSGLGLVFGGAGTSGLEVDAVDVAEWDDSADVELAAASDGGSSGALRAGGALPPHARRKPIDAAVRGRTGVSTHMDARARVVGSRKRNGCLTGGRT